MAEWLRGSGHDVFSVYESQRGIDDDTVLRIALDEKRILVTNDKDFGEKVYREKSPHHGVILMRLEDERSTVKIATLRRLLAQYADQIAGRFVVVTETRVRFGGSTV